MQKGKASVAATPSTRTFVFELTTEADAQGRPVYIAGNFNDWNVADERFRMESIMPGHYRLVVPEAVELPPLLDYKYLRGSWESVEVDQYGNEVSNRRVYTKQGKILDVVPRWRVDGQDHRPEFLPQIQVISDAFEIPQLIRTRRIAALLPYDYDQHPDKRYPVLYLQDGQNLFEDYAPFGSWGVDKKLAIMAERGTHEVIIIAIDHAEEKRIAEFTPSYHTRLGKGQGKKYVQFLTETLKPYVDGHFRTLSGREHTGIGGSSMGGLISIYAGLMYPQVYSKLMIFSPSLWVAPNIHSHSVQPYENYDTRVYLYGGGAEGANVIPSMEKLKAALEALGVTAEMDFELVIDPAGKHNEARWGKEFPRAIEWLYFNRLK